MIPVGFEPTISAGEQPQTYALDRASTGTGIKFYINTISVVPRQPEDGFLCISQNKLK